jgi:glucose/arabinose dehydrogenase
MRVVTLGIVLALAAAACRGATAPVSDAPPSPSASQAPPATASAPPATASAPPASASSAQATKVCMMVNVCDCNLGCAAIRVPPAMVREGTHAKVESGALAGKEVKIVKVVDASGATVLALTDLDHDHACSIAAERAFVGYACEAKKSGPVPAKACAKGCD